MWITVGGILLIYVVQLALAPLIGVTAALVGYVAAGAAMALAARAGRFSLGVRRPRARFVVAAVLIGISCWYLETEVVLTLHRYLPGDTKHLERTVEATPLALSLIVLALAPAISEELVFRGVLARCFDRRRAWLGVIVSAVVFSLYHLNPPQMVGVLPFGLALGFLAVRTGSIVPGMIAHLLNNVIVLLLQRVTVIDHHPELALIAAFLLFA
ncbi:MAG: CPBP family intramembrane glutamic endopeptidase, partial [Kofleriaceae bacterium]